MLKHRLGLILAVLAWISVVLADTENSIILMTPHRWQCDKYLTQTIMLDFLEANRLDIDELLLNLTLVSQKEPSQAHEILLKVDFLKSNGFREVDFQLPLTIEPGFYTLELTARNENSSYIFNQSLTQIECTQDGYGVYVLTDKPVYRDSDKVRIRIVYINPTLMPNDGSKASVFITDPKGNRIQQFLDVEFLKGIISGLELQLTERPIYGLWTIKVIVDGITKESTFSVKEYVLPKFDFTVDIPSYVLKSAVNFDANIEAKYTYGKPLDGDVIVRLSYETWQVKGPVENVTFDQSFKLTDGKLKVTVPLNDRNLFSQKLTVNVTDRFSLETRSKESQLRLVSEEFYVKDYTSDFVKGKSNHFEITLFEYSEKPYSDRNLNLLINIHKVNRATKIEKDVSKELTLKTDKSGKIEFNLKTGNDFDYIKIQISPVSDEKQIQWIYIYPRSVPEEEQKKSKLEVKNTTKSDLVIGSVMTLKLVKNGANSAKECLDAKYVVLGKFEVLNQGRVELCDEKTVDFEITPNHAPYSTFVAYFVDESMKVEVAHFDIEIKNFYRNELSIDFGNVSVVKPGELVNISLKTEPQSTVALSIIDKSVALMGSELNELTTSQISTQMSQLILGAYFGGRPIPTTPSPVKPVIVERNIAAKVRPGADIVVDGDMNWWGGGYWEKPKSLTDLNNQGLAVASDVKKLEPTFKSKHRMRPLWRVPVNFAVNEEAVFAAMEGAAVKMKDATMQRDSSINSPSPQTDTVVARSDFRETWIWDTFSLSEDESVKTISSKIPETITSWVATGFSLNQELGLAIANKKEITTFKDFFISTILPSSMIRGEKLRLQVIVYNYMDQEVSNVQVKMEKNEGFLEEDEDDGKLQAMTSDSVKTIEKLANQSIGTVEFVISPVKVGQLKVAVKAVSSLAGDGEVKYLKVKSEGIEIANTQSLLLSLDTDNDNGIIRDFSVRFPENVIDDSQFCSIQVIGDILGPSLNNLGNLIKKPYGCGEQNMITLVPNILALDYLLSINSSSSSSINNLESLIRNAKDNIIDGYQRQLTYALDDGSFSAFGKSDQVGSTWLTAFVLKSFVAAKKYAPQIDEKVIQKAAEFLLKQQENTDGSFVEHGRVIHTDMQGGVESRPTITAYVTSALFEAGDVIQNVKNATSSAVSYLEGQVASLKDSFSLGLVTYALDLAQSTRFDEIFDRFEAKSKATEDGGKYWPVTLEADVENDVELTSYGLLMSLRHKNVSDVVPIVRYLISKISGSGGFSGTQNTVLGLRALTEFALKTISKSKKDREVYVDVTIDGDSTNLKTFAVKDQNALVLQTFDLPKCPKTVSIDAYGSGSALFQMVSRYNIPKVPINVGYNLTQKTLESISQRIKVSTCVTYHGPKPTGMTLIEADLLSGYEVDKADMDRIVEEIIDVRKVEVKKSPDNKVVFYLNGLEPDDEVCIEWKMSKAFDVTNLKPVPVRVYDYYNSALQTSITFDPPNETTDSEKVIGLKAVFDDLFEYD